MRIFRIETNKNYLLRPVMARQERAHGVDGDTGRGRFGKTVYAGADIGEIQTGQTVLRHEPKAIVIGAAQQRRFMLPAAAPDGADGVDDVTHS